MISDLKSLLSKCNDFSTSALNAAAGQAVNRTHYEVAIEHYFLACIADPHSDIPLILGHFGVDIGIVARELNATIEQFRTGNAGRPALSPLLVELLESSWLLGSVDLGFAGIRSGAMLLAFLRKPAIYAQGSYSSVFSAINTETLFREFGKICQYSAENTIAETATKAAPVQSGFISKFCEDITAKARAGKIDPVFGRDQEIRQMVDILARRRKNNPILVGEPGVGKTAVLEGLALRIVEGDVPSVLADVSLLSLDLGLLEAGAGIKGEFERRLKGVLDEIKASEKPIVLFIDEAHMLVGAGGQAGGSDAANLMKPALARGEIRTCAATTWKEYKKYFEKDPALSRRFQLVKLDPPSVENTVLILRGIRNNYEKFHEVILRDDALKAAATLSDRYISGRFLPDKAIDLLDTACARVKVSITAKPVELEDKQRAVQAAERELVGLERDKENEVDVDSSRIEELKNNIDNLKVEIEELEKQWSERTTEDTNKAHQVTPEIIAQIVADWTGIPVGRMAQEQAAVIKDLEDLLAKKIRGQDFALKILAKNLQASSAGLKDPSQPSGVFLLVGPSGVGKTETGLALAELLFGDSRNVVSVNMSEFQEKHTVSRLIGSPPGYVGYGEGGMLTEAIRQRPYSVVLLDEVEKAHTDVLNLFYQVFDKGILTDSEGKEVSFKNTVILLTSNLASDIIQQMSADVQDVDYEELQKTIRPVLSKYFRPALLARMNIVPYRSLNDDILKEIAVLKLQSLAQRLKQNNNIELTWTPEVLDQIIARCTETETGARNIEYIMSGSVLPSLSARLLEQMADGEVTSKVHLSVGETGEFEMSFEN